MSEQVAPVEAVDPFNGEETTHEEFSKWRETGELPERFKAKETPAAPKEGETVEGQEPPKEPEQGKKEPERDVDGKFKAKEKAAEFTPEQQEAFDRAFKKREAKLRREYEARIADLTSKQTGTAPDKPETHPDAPPKRPELPKLSEYKGTIEEFDKEVAEYPAKLAAFLDSERQQKEKATSIKQRLDESEAKAKKAHPDYEDEFVALQKDIAIKDEPTLPDYVIKAIAEETEDPHELTYYLAKNREEFRRFAALTPSQTLKEVLKLDVKLGLQVSAPAPAKEQAPPKPKPPTPVGARAAATAFDVNDESLDADEWARQRNEQLAKRRR